MFMVVSYDNIWRLLAWLKKTSLMIKSWLMDEAIYFQSPVLCLVAWELRETI